MSGKKQTIESIIQKLDALLTQEHDEYVQLHEELNKHRGKQLEDTDLPEVNRLLKEIQEKFAGIYPALNFVGRRYEFSTNAVNSYNDFIEVLKKAGAHQIDPKPIETTLVSE